jgi:transcriptional regulator with XRE-family HTH domain
VEQGYTKTYSRRSADLAGMHFTSIGQIERGKRNPPLINLERLAKALKIDAGKLLPF